MTVAASTKVAASTIKTLSPLGRCHLMLAGPCIKPRRELQTCTLTLPTFITPRCLSKARRTTSPCCSPTTRPKGRTSCKPPPPPFRDPRQRRFMTAAQSPTARLSAVRHRRLLTTAMTRAMTTWIGPCLAPAAGAGTPLQSPASRALTRLLSRSAGAVV